VSLEGNRFKINNPQPNSGNKHLSPAKHASPKPAIGTPLASRFDDFIGALKSGLHSLCGVGIKHFQVVKLVLPLTVKSCNWS
jgi:hypothetical protein